MTDWNAEFERKAHKPTVDEENANVVATLSHTQKVGLAQYQEAERNLAKIKALRGRLKHRYYTAYGGEFRVQSVLDENRGTATDIGFDQGRLQFYSSQDTGRTYFESADALTGYLVQMFAAYQKYGYRGAP